MRRKNWITVARTQETNASSIGNNYGPRSQCQTQRR